MNYYYKSKPNLSSFASTEKYEDSFFDSESKISPNNSNKDLSSRLNTENDFKTSKLSLFGDLQLSFGNNKIQLKIDPKDKNNSLIKEESKETTEVKKKELV